MTDNIQQQLFQWRLVVNDPQSFMGVRNTFQPDPVKNEPSVRLRTQTNWNDGVIQLRETNFNSSWLEKNLKCS